MLTVERADVYAVTDTPSVDRIQLKTADFTLTTLPVEIGELSESMALAGKRRLHNSEDDSEASFEISNQIPFGTEPEIQRRIRISHGLACVTMDIVMRASCSLTTLSAGGFVLEGDIRKVGFLLPPVKGCTFPKPEMKDFSAVEAENGILYDETFPPLGLIIESENARMDWMAGDDLWRWTNASNIGGTSRFIVSRAGNSLKFTWKIFEKNPVRKTEEDLPVPGRNWRLTWAVSWKRLPLPAVKAPHKSFDAVNYPWPESTIAMAFSGKVSAKGRSCLCADATLAVLKKWLRSSLNSVQDGDEFGLKEVEPVFCSNAGHLDRAGKKSLAHWDMMAIIEFSRWANRQLAKQGASLKVFAPEKSPLHGFMILK